MSDVIGRAVVSGALAALRKAVLRLDAGGQTREADDLYALVHEIEAEIAPPTNDDDPPPGAPAAQALGVAA